MSSEKYFKYKNKYLSLKNSQTGGVIYQCPYGNPCKAGTNYMGLCVRHQYQCNQPYNKINATLPTVVFEQGEEELKAKAETGIKKNYTDGNLTNSCLEHTDKPRVYYTCKLDGSFSILTLNVMGICRKDKDIALARLRALLLIDEILDKQPDILCFQEMSKLFLEMFYVDEIKLIYPYIYEYPIFEEDKKDIDCCFISKYPPRKVIMQNLTGVLDYPNTLQIIEFENVIIFNCYLQAGSKFSQGQETKALHYSRCRSQYFDYIKKLISKYTGKAIILLGDLNFDLNFDIMGTELDWAESKQFLNMGLFDSWRTINGYNPGLTENTTLNSMRWNSKLLNKHFRYDAILYNNQLKPVMSTIFGDKSKELYDNDNLIYENAIIQDVYLGNDGIRKINGNYELFISDHFGVLSTFTFKQNRR